MIQDPLDIACRLDELRCLENGWLEGEGKALSQEGLDWLSNAFDRNYSDDLPLPYLYPTAEGNIQAEWSFGEKEITLEIDLKAHTAILHVANMKGGDDLSQELNMNEARPWEILASIISPTSEKR